MNDPTALQILVRERMQDLGLSTRQAAARSAGLISAQTVSRFSSDERYAPKRDPQVLAGLALALDVPLSVIERAADDGPSLCQILLSTPPERRGVVERACRAFQSMTVGDQDRFADEMERVSRSG